MTWDLPPARAPKGVHANLICSVPGPQPHWLDWDGYYEAEDLACRMERVTPCDASVPEGTQVGVMFPTPWAADRSERVAIAREVVASMQFAEGEYDSVTVQTAIDCTVFARRFERWIDSKLEDEK